jgi:hypothetical protein
MGPVSNGEELRLVGEDAGSSRFVYHNIFILYLSDRGVTKIEDLFTEQRALISELDKIVIVVLVDAATADDSLRKRIGQHAKSIKDNTLCAATAILGAGFVASVGLALGGAILRLSNNGYPRALVRDARGAAKAIAGHVKDGQGREIALPEIERVLEGTLSRCRVGQAA